MGKATGFLDFEREEPEYQSVEERLKHFNEFVLKVDEDDLRNQAARCMNCGIPFCHNNCPLGNLIPDWNDLIYAGHWELAWHRLNQTNNFPEVTGRICPAPCEYACTLGINAEPVAIKLIEKSIADYSLRQGWVQPEPPGRRTGKRVAVVGGGPAGMACAQQLNRAGHETTLFEMADRIGGLLRYGIPDFKLNKNLIANRVQQMQAEGVIIRTGTKIGQDIAAAQLAAEYDAVVLTGGAMMGRELPVLGRELKGVYQAMEYLTQQNRINAGDKIPAEERILAQGKHVVVIGGGDTGSDCIGTANRQGALSVRQFEIMPKPPLERTAAMPWPHWPAILRTSSSHEEGAIRQWSISTTEFSGENGMVKGLRGHSVRMGEPDANGRRSLEVVPGSEYEIQAELVLLAMGFVHPEHEGMVKELGLELDERGNVRTDQNFMTSRPGIFAAGDMHRGASLVVWAIAEGRQAAREADRYLMGETTLP